MLKKIFLSAALASAMFAAGGFVGKGTMKCKYRKTSPRATR